jgi:secreted trypsin-like serine protease
LNTGDKDSILQSSSQQNTNDFNLPHCGITRKKGGQIVGGEKAAAGEFPWIVSFQRPKPDGVLSHFCGGAVINERLYFQ